MPRRTEAPSPNLEARDWLKAHGYGYVADLIDQIEAEWRAAGKRTRRSWWDVLAGSPQGRPRRVAGRTFPVIPEARTRQQQLRQGARQA